jgi:hypothetical protein
MKRPVRYCAGCGLHLALDRQPERVYNGHKTGISLLGVRLDKCAVSPQGSYEPVPAKARGCKRMQTLILSSSIAAVSSGWKWIAILIGLGVVVVLYLLYALSSRNFRHPSKVFEGLDGVSSTSKFQWTIWLAAILIVYVALWVIRVKQGDWSSTTKVPANVLTVLGFSTATAAAAKGITAGYVQTNRVSKADPANRAKPPGGLLQDDDGVPELAKIQMVGFTLVAVGIFVATFFHQIFASPILTSLPNIDSSLLVLMGISQGGYLGKKIVSFGPGAH